MARRSQRNSKKIVDYFPSSPSFIKGEVENDSKLSEDSESEYDDQRIRKTQKEKKQTTKISGKNQNDAKSETTDLNTTEISEYDDQPIRETKKEKKEKKQTTTKISGKNQKDAKSETTDLKTTELSEYEKQILLNIEERKKMFEMMVGDAKKDFLETLSPATKEKASQRGLKRKIDISIEVPPIRMSLRSRVKIPHDETRTENDLEVKKSATPKTYKSGPFTMREAYLDQDSVADAKFIEEIIPLLEIKEEFEKLPSDQQDFLKLMKSFTIKDEGIAKVVKSRIYSLNWHPSSSKLLLAAGDRDGNIGFWDIDSLEDKQQGVRAFKVHTMPINCTTFDKFNTTRLLTTSYDGNVRCMDLQTNVIDEVYSIKRTNNTWTAYHAQKDPSTLVVSQSNGDVVVVDVRTKPGRVQNLIQCFEMSARTVSLHPQDDNLFMVCNRYGEVGIFDMRYTTENEDDLAVPIISFPKAPKGVHGAFFSSITGKYALTTCTDDTIKLYDVQKGSSEAEGIKSIKHNNFTGRWLSPFKAMWHPTRDDVFIVGSMEHPRRVELYGAPTGQLLHNFSSPLLVSVTSVNAFHPAVPIFAGGNSSGRVHIFRT